MVTTKDNEATKAVETTAGADGPPTEQPAAAPVKPRSRAGTAIQALLVLAFAVGLAYVARQRSQSQTAVQGVMTKDELARYGADGDGPLYLALLGQVFDVSKKREIYGKGGGYSFFCGVDGTRAFITGQFKTETNDDVSGMTDKEFKGLVEWRDFYHKDYTYVGKLHGAFYDAAGRPTAALKQVEAGAKRAAAEEEAEKEREKQYVKCSIRWTQEEGGVVWCENGLHPRKVIEEVSGGPPNSRCACFEDVGWSDVRQLYPGCDPKASRCATSPPSHT